MYVVGCIRFARTSTAFKNTEQLKASIENYSTRVKLYQTIKWSSYFFCKSTDLFISFLIGKFLLVTNYFCLDRQSFVN